MNCPFCATNISNAPFLIAHITAAHGYDSEARELIGALATTVEASNPMPYPAYTAAPFMFSSVLPFQPQRDAIALQAILQEQTRVSAARNNGLRGGNWKRVTANELALEAYVFYTDGRTDKTYCLEKSSGNRYYAESYKRIVPSGDIDAYLVPIEHLPGEPDGEQKEKLSIRNIRKDPL